MADLMSSDESDDDSYNYLSLLDNLNWDKCDEELRQWYPKCDNNNDTNSEKPKKNTAKKVPEVLTKPAVAVQHKSNRMASLMSDMMSSKNCKFNTTSTENKPKTLPKEVVNNNNKRAINVDSDVIVINEFQTINNSNRNNTNNCDKSNNNSSNTNMNNKYKKIRYSQTDYSVESVLASKRANHSVATEKGLTFAKKLLPNERNFGKAFSPTVYPPSIAVSSIATTSNAIKSKSFRLKPQPNYISFEENNKVKDSKYSSDNILSIILDWKPQWLKEFAQSEVPPPLSPFGEGIGLKTNYETHEEYQSAYIPLILFETWAQIYEDYWKYSEKVRKNSFNAVVAPDYSSKDNYIVISFQTTCAKHAFHSDNYASEGDLIMVELNIDGNGHNDIKKLMVFAYVTDYSCETLNPNTPVLTGVVVPQGPSLLLKYVILISKRTLRLNNKNPINVRKVYYLKPTIRQIEVISQLHSSLLFKDILKPRLFTCQIVVPTNISLNNRNFNESQNKAILGSSEALSRPYLIPKLLLIQGPPGTGKTHTLIGIIKHIYLSWEDKDLPRILICAPSNGAVDEIARRLYTERRFLDKSKFKRSLRCVRVGQPSQIHPDVKKILLEKLVEDNADNDVKNVTNKINSKTSELESRIAKLDQEIANNRASGQKNQLINAENEMQCLLRELQRVGTNTKTVEVNKHRLKMEIMVKADIVLSTLNSCHQSPIEMLFKNYGPNTFNCVIVDEASQCTEPELLMPLKYKMTKMILIGDPMQLSATVISKKANSLHLGRSLFERFFKYFSEHKAEQKSPVLMLNQQYRMHPQICEFPSKHFYSGQLLSSEKVVQNRTNFKIKPYIVFDITDSQESRNDPSNKFNELEANFVIKLVKIVNGLIGSHHSLGIITPYNGQKKVISGKIRDLNLNIRVEVNTVDGFQGQERDVIILSCVRAFESANGNNLGFIKSVQRMNVALTRSKYSLILCISGRSLENDDNWKALIDDAIKRTGTRYKVPSTLSTDKITKMIQNNSK